MFLAQELLSFQYRPTFSLSFIIFVNIVVEVEHMCKIQLLLNLVGVEVLIGGSSMYNFNRFRMLTMTGSL